MPANLTPQYYEAEKIQGSKRADGKTGSSGRDAAASVHKDFLARLEYARIWGSGKHDGLRVIRNHVRQDGDIIELHA